MKHGGAESIEIWRRERRAQRRNFAYAGRCAIWQNGLPAGRAAKSWPQFPRY
jgi:hypothetical protein